MTQRLGDAKSLFPKALQEQGRFMFKCLDIKFMKLGQLVKYINIGSRIIAIKQAIGLLV